MIQAFYTNIQGDYGVALSRMQNDDRIRKYLGFFLEDTSYAMLESAMQEGNCEEAFRAAHTLKGVCQNMAFTYLSTIVEQITEELRAKDFAKAQTTFPEVAKRYQLVIEEIHKIV